MDRRQQLRLIGLIALLGLVIVAIDMAAKPEMWHWIAQPAEENADGRGEDGRGQGGPVDFAVRGREPLPHGTFEVVADVDVPAVMNGELEAGELVVAGALAVIEDNTLGLSRAEGQAYADILSRLAIASDRDLAVAARNDATFTVVMKQPEEYRGDVIKLRGELRRLGPFPGVEQLGGPADLYEGWVFTRDSRTNPYRVVATAVDPALPTGLDLEPVMVELEGVFFKRFGYASKGGQHVAPLLLAKTIRAARTAAPVEDDGSQLILAGLMLLCVLGLSAAALFLHRNAKRKPIAFKVGDGGGETIEETAKPKEFLETLVIEEN